MAEFSEGGVRPIYIVGDSHVRSFSYSNSFIPLFIGPAAFNNFLTESRTNHTVKKIMCISSKLSINDTLILMLGGGVRHFAKDASNTQKSVEQLDLVVKNYIPSIRQIRDSFPGKLIVCLSFPPVLNDNNDIECHQYYNAALGKELESEDVTFVDISNPISENKLLKPKYTLDVLHVSYLISPILLDAIELEGVNVYSDKNNEYPWSYLYEIPTKDSGPYKIWGDCVKENLLLDKNQIHIQFYQQKTLLIQCYCRVISKLLMSEHGDTKLDLMVVECKDGLVNFELAENIIFKNILGCDSSRLSICRAKMLNSLYGYRNVEFNILCNEPSEVLTECHIVICFERYNWTNPSKLIFFKEVKSKCEIFFFSSYNVKNDMNVLKKSGFSTVLEIKRNQKIIAHGNLLLATNVKLSKNTIKTLRKIKRDLLWKIFFMKVIVEPLEPYLLKLFSAKIIERLREFKRRLM